MKTLDQALRIIEGSKQFDFVEGQNGCTVLEIINYFTGERLAWIWPTSMTKSSIHYKLRKRKK